MRFGQGKPFLEKLVSKFCPGVGWRKFLSYYRLRLVRIQASPHSIALGFAVGGLLACTPLFGLHMLLAVVLAWLLRSSVIASLISVNVVGIPFALPFYWYVSFQVGVRVLGMSAAGGNGAEQLSRVTWRSLIGGDVGGFFHGVFLPTLLGSLIVGAVIAGMCYVVVYNVVSLYHRHRIRSRRKKESGLGAGDHGDG